MDPTKPHYCQTRGPQVRTDKAKRLRNVSHDRCREAEVLDRARFAAERQIYIEERHGKPRSLVHNGVWLVPVADRPAGWEKWPVREK